MARRLLVTGGAGFIGSALVRRLVLTCGDAVADVDKLTYAADVRALAAVSDDPRHRLVRADVGDRAALDALFADFRPHAVLHLAAETHVDRSIVAAEDFVRTNVVGTYTLLEAARAYWSGLDAAAREAFRFLHVSTDEVYGPLGAEGRVDESAPYAPGSPYAASKAGADHLVGAWWRTYGLPTLIAHPANNFGPYQRPDKLIPLAIANAVEGRRIPVYGSGEQVRDWLSVDDHVAALTTILERGVPGERYNVGAGSERTNLALVRGICELLDALRSEGAPHARLIEHVDDRPGHDWRYALDASKLTRELGWRPARDFDSELEATVRWYLDHEDWWRPLGAHRR